MDFDEFLQCCRDDDESGVRAGLAEQDLTEHDADGYTPLMLCVKNGNLAMVQALLPGSDVQQTDNDGWSALRFALLGFNDDIVAAVLPHSNLQELDHRGNTLLMAMTIHDRADRLARFLHDRPQHQNEDGRTALMIAARHGSLHCLEKLLPVSDVSQIDGDGKTALAWAHRAGKPEVVEAMLTYERRLLTQASERDLPGPESSPTLARSRL